MHICNFSFIAVVKAVISSCHTAKVCQSEEDGTADVCQRKEDNANQEYECAAPVEELRFKGQLFGKW